MIEERCIRCGTIIVASSRSRFNRRYTEHVVDVHGMPAMAGGGA